MKAIELIQRLEELIKEHGDFEVYLDEHLLEQDDMQFLYGSDGWIMVID